MRLSNVTDARLQLLAEQYRSIASKHIDPAIFEELVDRRAAMSADRVYEMSMAYSHASSLIEGACLYVDLATDAESGQLWWDLDKTENEHGLLVAHDPDEQSQIDQAAAYLDSRGLLVRLSSDPRLVRILDEDEAIRPTRSIDHTHPQHQHPEEVD